MIRSLRSPWFNHGLWNTFEHALTRILDAAVSLILLWFLPTEQFSKLALAQALIAPLLLFFIAPETVLYRDFAVWKAEGDSVLLRRLRALRRFAWSKALLALLMAFLLAWLVPGDSNPVQRFYALVWAFALSLTPQVAGADREFLRLDLKLRDLSGVSFLQKSTLAVGTLAVSMVWHASLGALALVAVCGLVLTAWVSRFRVESGMKGIECPPIATRDVVEVVQESVRGFSIWNHLVGVITNWIQTMDLFFLGVFRFPAREVGMYAAVLKLSNFTLALPMALANLFSIRVGRTGPIREAGSHQAQTRSMWRFTGALFLFSIIQAAALWFVSPWMIGVLSRGRWSVADQSAMKSWLEWILFGSALLGGSLILSSWLTLRGNLRRNLIRIYVPWAAFSLLIYATFTMRAGLIGAAQGNTLITLVYLFLLFISSRFSEKA